MILHEQQHEENQFLPLFLSECFLVFMEIRWSITGNMGQL